MTEIDLTLRETMPGHFDWSANGKVIAHNVPAGESPELPSGWEWVGYRRVRVPAPQSTAETRAWLADRLSGLDD